MGQANDRLYVNGPCLLIVWQFRELSYHICKGIQRHLAVHDCSPCLEVTETNEINDVLLVREIALVSI